MIAISRKHRLYIASAIVLSIVIIQIVAGVYYLSFAPKTKVAYINKEIKLDRKNLLKKFLPNDFDISLKEVYVESDAIFTEEELEDLFISAIKDMPELKEIITGVGVYTDKDYINLYFRINYKKIPVEAKLIFSCRAENGKGIFHYKEGRIGFIPISKEMIFNQSVDTSIIEFDKNNGDIILSFDIIKQLDVRKVTTTDNGINIVFRGTIKFWDWLEK